MEKTLKPAGLLLFATMLSLIWSNIPAVAGVYGQLQAHLLHVTNEGLMPLFFLLMGLEIKYELRQGQLNTWSSARLPAIAAIGGMVVPALIYLGMNAHHPVSWQGWAIPTATDIAFSLGLLAVLGSRVPSTLKILLMALAIVDDLLAIIIIAVFYTAQIDGGFLGLSVGCVLVLAVFNKMKVERIWLYGLVGLGLWYALTKAGVHATLAGVILAFFIPPSIGQRCQHVLHPWVAFLILPVFAFANAGVSFVHISFSQLEWSVVWGIFLGLFVGKQLGIIGFVWLAVKFGWASLPSQLRWWQLYGMSILCGIGFTISLFIGTLAFGDYSSHLDSVKIGVLAASLFAGGVGYGVLRKMREK